MSVTHCISTTDIHGKELVIHGTPQFPIGCYHDVLHEMVVPWHWHEELEVAIVVEGSAIITSGSEKYIISEGNGIFINTEVLHGAWNLDDSRCRCHSLVFHPRLIGGSLDSIYWKNYLYPLMRNPAMKSVIFDHTIPWQKEALNHIETAWKACVHEHKGYEFEVRDELSCMIYLLCANSGSEKNGPSEKTMRDGERIKQMLQYIQDHFSEELTTTQIASAALISESECLRCFHNTIGTTPIQYVKQFRIGRAAELLTTTNDKITEISIQCGFQEMSYFSKSFKQIMGCTPREYRSQNE